MRTGIFHFIAWGVSHDYNMVSDAKKDIEAYLIETGQKEVVLYRNKQKYGMYWIDSHTGKLSGVRYKYE